MVPVARNEPGVLLRPAAAVARRALVRAAFGSNRQHPFAAGHEEAAGFASLLRIRHAKMDRCF